MVCSICKCCWYLDVYNDQYQTRHLSCSRSVEQVHVDTKERALNDCEESFLVFVWDNRLRNMLSRKTRI